MTADDGRQLLDLWRLGSLPNPQPESPTPHSTSSTDDPLPTGQQALDHLFRRFMQRVGADCRDWLAQWTHNIGNRFDIATACSGTELPKMVFDSLARVCTSDLSSPLTVESAFAAELSPWKQRFIRQAFPGLPCMFSDARDLGRIEAHDVISGGPVRVPPAKCLVAGFPCTDLSLLSSHSSSVANRSCILNATLRTGGVYAGLMEYIDAHGHGLEAGLESIVFENVVALASPPRDQKRGNDCGPTNLQVCLARLAKRGWYGKPWKLTPTLFGVPQCRPRIYITCFPTSILAELHMTLAEFDSWLSHMMAGLVGSEMQSVNDYLHDEQHHAIQAEYARLRRHSLARSAADDGNLRLDMRRSPATKWPEQHARGAGPGEEWWLNYEIDVDNFPGMLDLNDREVDHLRHHDIVVPEQVPTILDVNPSQVRTTVMRERVGCMVPRARFFLAHRGRMMTGTEALRFQNIWLKDSMELQMLEEFGSRSLIDLAGNAMEGCCLGSAVFLCTLVAARRVALRSTALGPPPSVPSIQILGELDDTEDDGFDISTLWPQGKRQQLGR